MNKVAIVIAIFFLTFSLGIKGQTTTGTPDANYSILKNKLKRSEDDLNDEKKNTSVKYWLSRAEMFMDIYEVYRGMIMVGTDKANVMILLGGSPAEQKTWQEEGSNFEEYKYEHVTVVFKDTKVETLTEVDPLHETPLEEALVALDKAKETDIENKKEKNIKEDYDRLKKLFERQGIEQFFVENYKDSFKSFSNIYLINEKPVMEGIVDTTMLYYSGLAASKAGLVDESINYYELARKYNYPEPDLYVFLKQKYWETGDTATGVQVLEDGFKKFPENQPILIELINYYLIADRSQDALEYLKLAQEDDPENISFIFAEATLYDKMGDTDKALETYKKCILLDPQFFNAYYNIGVMYYNKAVEMYKAADEIKDADEYEVAKQEAEEVLHKSVPYMEQAHEIDKSECSTMETLKTLYYRMQLNDKYEEMKAEIESSDCSAE
ncbi:MAG: tetratricopeptide repeat protein [Bacteroidales bacterium]|nr:tetratricopeptide repeat protein [Bacteroidales bacterium]